MTTSKGIGLIFVFEESKAREFVDSVLRMTEKIVVVCGTEQLSKKLSGPDYRCINMANYSTDSELRYVAEWMKRWPDTPILKGKNIKELFVYEGISLYWFLQTRFYLHRVRDLLILIQRIKHVLETEKPDKIWIKGSNDARLIISQLQGEHNIAGFEQLEQPSQHKVRHKSYQGHPMLKLLLLKLMRGTFHARSRKRVKSEKRILVVTEVSNWRRDFNHVLEKYQTKDVIFDNIVRQLADRGVGVTIVDFENRPGQLLKSRSINKSRQASFGVPVNPWEKYIGIGMIMKTRNVSEKFADLWQQVLGSEEFAKSLTYENVSLYELVKGDFEDLFKSLKAYAAITLIEASKRIIEAEHPSVVVMHDEYGALQISLINESRKQGIPSVSIQHGLVSEEQISYVHEEDHITGENRELLFPIPDIMCSWSENSRQNLIDIAKFPKSIPVVTGDPRVDYLPEALKKFDRRKIIQKLGITDKKIITFATENLPSEEEKLVVAKTIFRAVREIPECHLIIKMHPNEMDIGFYERLATTEGMKTYSILRDINLYELLYVSNLVILSYSTVAVEAMRMGKPVISLDLMNLHEGVSFIKNKFAIVVKNVDDLLPSIQNCLALTPEVQEIVRKATAFAEEQLGVLDGKASERIVRVILKASQANQRTLLLGEGSTGRE